MFSGGWQFGYEMPEGAGLSGYRQPFLYTNCWSKYVCLAVVDNLDMRCQEVLDYLDNGSLFCIQTGELNIRACLPSWLIIQISKAPSQWFNKEMQIQGFFHWNLLSKSILVTKYKSLENTYEIRILEIFNSWLIYKNCL